MLGKSIKFVVKLTIATFILFINENKSEASSNAFMDTGKFTSIPIGHYEFCKSHPKECKTKTHGDVRVQLTKRNWQALIDINYRANKNIVAVTDADLYGAEEHWTYPSHAGDCEDYVLQKRIELMAQGWPASALLITVVLQPNGEGHAVLTVRTDRGDLILDNLEDKVKLWSDTPYTYIKRQSKNHTGKWETINDTRVGFVGSVRK